MFEKKRKILKVKKNDSLDKPFLGENSVDFSLFHWRSSNEFAYLAYRPRFTGLVFIDRFDPNPVTTLYSTYLLQLNLVFMLRKQNKHFWGGVLQSLNELRWTEYFEFLSIHFVYFMDLWTRPKGILDVWTNEEEIDYATIRIFYLHYYVWSHPKLFINFSFIFLSEFVPLFSLAGPTASFVSYDSKLPYRFDWSYYDPIDWLPVKVYDIQPLMADELLLEPILAPFSSQRHYDKFPDYHRDFFWYDNVSTLLLQNKWKYNLADFYYFFSYMLRKSYFLYTLFFDPAFRKVYHYGVLGFFFFDSHLHTIEEVSERVSTLSVNPGAYLDFNADVLGLAEELEVEEEDWGYEHFEEEFLFLDEDTDEDEDEEEDDLYELEDVEDLEEPDYLDFEVEEDVDDEMEFNEDRLSI